MGSARKRILVLADYYLPAYKAGGAVRSIAGMIDHLGDRFRFDVLTRDSDLGDDYPHECVAEGRTRAVGNATCRYLAPGDTRLGKLRAAIRSTPHDTLYLNSTFSPAFTIGPLILRRLRLIPRVPVVVAPHGELDPGALEQKRAKKRAYLAVAKGLRLYEGILWQASNPGEQQSIRSWFGAGTRIHLAPEFMGLSAPGTLTGRTPKEPGRLRAVFLSRLSPKKNLLFALDALRGVTGDVTLDIYGPKEDCRYWERCQDVMDHLPDNVRVHYGGAVAHEQVEELLQSYDLLFLPTLGESFGWVILEALLAGCLVLTSDRTPWPDLDELGVGWTLPLRDRDGFRSVLEYCCAMTPPQHDQRSRAAAHWSRQLARDPDAVRRNAALFETQS